MKKIIALMFLVIGSFLFASSSPSTEETDVAPQYINYFNSGLKAQNNGSYEEAIGYYQKAVDEKSDYADAWNNMGFCYRMIAKGDLSKSGDAYAKALQSNPQHVAALEYQGEYFVMVGQLMSAYRNYQTLKKMNSSEAVKVKNKLDAVLDEAQAVLKNYSP